jgi:hypothetical protein
MDSRYWVISLCSVIVLVRVRGRVAGLVFAI